MTVVEATSGNTFFAGDVQTPPKGYGCVSVPAMPQVHVLLERVP